MPECLFNIFSTLFLNLYLISRWIFPQCPETLYIEAHPDFIPLSLSRSGKWTEKIDCSTWPLHHFSCPFSVSRVLEPPPPARFSSPCSDTEHHHLRCQRHWRRRPAALRLPPTWIGFGTAAAAAFFLSTLPRPAPPTARDGSRAGDPALEPGETVPHRPLPPGMLLTSYFQYYTSTSLSYPSHALAGGQGSCGGARIQAIFPRQHRECHRIVRSFSAGKQVVVLA